ncbi:MAG: M15 family metallopeptidase [Acidimicrobiales bacterium]
MAALLWLVVGASILVAALGERAVVRARVQAGADAVALTAASGWSVGAIAAENDVDVEQLHGSSEVDVVVSNGSVSAAARARSSRQELSGLDPRMLEAISRAESALGTQLLVVSGFRSRADQERLWLARDSNPYPVAPPGTSMHEAGLAIDVALHQANSLAIWAAQVGLCRPLPDTDPVHFVVC